MNVYIAHNFEAKNWLKNVIVPLFENAGHFVTSRWIKEDLHVLLSYATQGAIEDIEDINAASDFVLFVDQWGERAGRGKYFELGYAIRAGKRCIIVGDNRDCVFYNLPNIRKFKFIEEVISSGL